VNLRPAQEQTEQVVAWGIQNATQQTAIRHQGAQPTIRELKTQAPAPAGARRVPDTS
jgi:hypothetical protein